jgi:hypothetical protein
VAVAAVAAAEVAFMAEAGAVDFAAVVGPDSRAEPVAA